MTKKAQAATAAATDQVGVQTSAPATEETVTAPTTADQVEQAGTTTEQQPGPAVASAEQQPEPVRGRALIDLPAHGLKCGEFGTLPAAVAQSLADSGEFDPKAVEA